jgi:hypothetical protein
VWTRTSETCRLNPFTWERFARSFRTVGPKEEKRGQSTIVCRQCGMSSTWPPASGLMNSARHGFNDRRRSSCCARITTSRPILSHGMNGAGCSRSFPSTWRRWHCSPSTQVAGRVRSVSFDGSGNIRSPSWTQASSSYREPCEECPRPSCRA